MGVVNRCAIGISAKEPMRAWAQAMEPEAPLIDDLEPSLYLIPIQDQDRPPPNERLREHVLPIFREELRCWCEDPSLWPQPLTLELFLLWFDVRFYGLIDDLAMEQPLRNQPTPDEHQLLEELLREINGSEP
ncbi:hypothetical protein SynRS9909_01319 [Synechococcus sp. RS9909]|uniref:hypothetical protein n=1 Tax=unclassified Synechococcus TaxID=2626047 RepID=UPI000068F858|nr:MULTISPECIES: hypothetical protein [unclassified Synechococcus]EAQ69435.1 hypothetical protein RS9917_13365 [Synechococcus sp. RS9917]QNI79306.1 hypothetical protein SynRS9909_01319 [Synechococcus sp. RS9909]